ncbi:DUF1643 domain-containing protein [Rhodanobacter sp. FW106-PBR-R2A-1-13]|uniref:DUF1643 domain-containing protein n=1 Tax=Rhodanobacter sp. FW106-PBR-R2A-1-13 TaxID=3454845 RepID=UPI0034E59586
MSAVLSLCGRYRYRLERNVGLTGIVIAYFGVNPSTADSETEDATSRKWAGFARVNGARRYIAGNAFAFRATDVRRLATADDPVGSENAAYLQGIIADADILVPCWGSRRKLPPPLWPQLDQLAGLLRASGKPIKVLGITASGDPAHPLVLGYRTPLTDWLAR